MQLCGNILAQIPKNQLELCQVTLSYLHVCQWLFNFLIFYLFLFFSIASFLLVSLSSVLLYNCVTASVLVCYFSGFTCPCCFFCSKENNKNYWSQKRKSSILTSDGKDLLWLHWLVVQHAWKIQPIERAAQQLFSALCEFGFILKPNYIIFK